MLLGLRENDGDDVEKIIIIEPAIKMADVGKT
jgi:hypothetical protein